MRKNVFAAKPAKFAGRQMMGVISHPGFHTTDRYGVACNYANAKVDQHTPSEWTATLKRGWHYPMSDYPVVVSLVMNGLERLPDYDAFEFWAPAVQTTFEEFEQYGNGEDVDAFADFVEGRDTFTNEEASPSSAVDALSLILDGSTNEQVGRRILDWITDQPDPEGALRFATNNPDDPAFLMHITQQFRYLEDVDERRICGVDYMRPFFDHLLPHYDDPEWEEQRWEDREARIVAAGYATVTLADVYDSHDPTVVKTVYEVPPESIRTPDSGQLHFGDWHTPKPRVEYHGTSYLNFRAAAPGLASHLPPPPPPYEEG